jgi:hypothetical protein
MDHDRLAVGQGRQRLLGIGRPVAPPAIVTSSGTLKAGKTHGGRFGFRLPKGVDTAAWPSPSIGFVFKFDRQPDPAVFRIVVCGRFHSDNTAAAPLWKDLS